MHKQLELTVDPLPALLAWEDAALGYFVRRDLLKEPVPPVETLWKTKTALKLTQAQQPDGTCQHHIEGVGRELQNNRLDIEIVGVSHLPDQRPRQIDQRHKPDGIGPGIKETLHSF